MEYSVRDGSQEIGSVQTPYIIGQLFSLAGYYGGCQYVDVVENLAIEIAKELFLMYKNN